MNGGEEVVRRYTRSRTRRRMLDVDLNAAPPCESRDQAGTSNRTRSQGRQASQEGGATLPPPIDLEAFDDDVIISSPRAFAEAKNNNSRRNRGRTIVVDVDSDERPSRNKRRKAPSNQTIINCDLYINLEGSSNPMRKSGESGALPPAPPPPPPKEPVFSCPVCMGPLVEEMTTKCGHIFCKQCIKAAIAAQSKCPTCRRKTTAKDIIRFTFQQREVLETSVCLIHPFTSCFRKCNFYGSCTKVVMKELVGCEYGGGFPNKRFRQRRTGATICSSQQSMMNSFSWEV